MNLRNLLLPLGLLASAAHDRSLWHAGGRRGRVNRPSGKVQGVLGKGSARRAPRFQRFGAREVRSR